MDFSLIADWCIIVFFIWFGLKKFIPTLNEGYFETVGAILALVTAVSTFLSL